MLKIEPWRGIIIIICVALLVGGGGDALFQFGSIGYTTGYEGVKASFCGIEYNAEGSSGQADLTGNSFYLDPDDPTLYAPNLVGEMTNAFVPEKSVRPEWVFPELWEGTEYIRNPVQTYEWNLPNPDAPNETIAYVVEEWLLRMYVSISAEWDDAGLITAPHSREIDSRYTNTRVWIELDISPIWIFEGADQTYFGLSKVVTSDVAKGKLGTTEDDYTPTAQFSVNPNSGTSYRYLYYSKYGTTQFDPTDPKTYQGRILNPEIFTDKMYFHLDLVNFGTESWTDWTSPISGVNIKGDVVTWGFDVRVFVVGEWKVKDIEDIPEDYGRDPIEQYGLAYYLARFLANPRGQFWLLVGIGALFVLGCALFCPWVLLSFIGVLRGFGSSGGNRKR